MNTHIIIKKNKHISLGFIALNKSIEQFEQPNGLGDFIHLLAWVLHARSLQNHPLWVQTLDFRLQASLKGARANKPSNISPIFQFHELFFFCYRQYFMKYEQAIQAILIYLMG